MSDDPLPRVVRVVLFAAVTLTVVAVALAISITVLALALTLWRSLT